ncbi:MAG: hypothetical protein HEEMFOPI_00683 [Holosporales bacterium]
MKYLTCKKLATFGFMAAMINGAFAIDPSAAFASDPTSTIQDTAKKSFFDIVKELENFRDETENAKKAEETRRNEFTKMQLQRDAQYSEIMKKLAAAGSTKEGLADLKKFMSDKSQQAQTDVLAIIKQVSDAVTKFDIENKKATGMNATKESLENNLAPLTAKVDQLRKERDDLETKLNAAAAALAASGANATSAADVAALQAQVDALTKQAEIKKQTIKNNLALKARTKDASIDAKNAAIKAEMDALEQKKAALNQQIASSNTATFAAPADAQKTFDATNKALIAKDRELKPAEKQKAAIEARIKKQQDGLITVMNNMNQYQKQLEALVAKAVNTIYGIEKSTPTEVPAVQLEQPKTDDLVSAEDVSAEAQQAMLSGDSSLSLGDSSAISEPTATTDVSVAPDVTATTVLAVPASTAVAAAPQVPATTMDNVNKFIESVQKAHKAVNFDFKNPQHQEIALKRCSMGVTLALNGDIKVRNALATFMSQNPQATGVSRASLTGALDASARSKLNRLLDVKNTSAQVVDVRPEICGQ